MSRHPPAAGEQKPVPAGLGDKQGSWGCWGRRCAEPLLCRLKPESQPGREPGALPYRPSRAPPEALLAPPRLAQLHVGTPRTLTPLSSGPLRSPHLPLCPGRAPRCSGSVGVVPREPPPLPPPQAVLPTWLLRALRSDSSLSCPRCPTSRRCLRILDRQTLSGRGVPLPCSPGSPPSLLGVVCPVPGRCPSGIPRWEFGACLSPRVMSHLLSYPDSDLLLFPLGTPTLMDHLGALCSS